jgi:hypothetical protein
VFLRQPISATVLIIAALLLVVPVLVRRIRPAKAAVQLPSATD